MPGITALTILLTIYATGEMIAKKTKAVFSTVLGIAMLLLAGFWTGILPETIFSDCGADKFGNVIAGILITSLGTTIDFEELKRQWKVVLVSLMGVLGAVAGFIAAGCLFGMREMAIAGAPVFAGGSAATLIMTTALKDRSMELASTFCIVLYVMQKFIGVPVASHFLRIEARNFRKITENIQLYRNKRKGIGIAKRQKASKPPPIIYKTLGIFGKAGSLRHDLLLSCGNDWRRSPLFCNVSYDRDPFVFFGIFGQIYTSKDTGKWSDYLSCHYYYFF